MISSLFVLWGLLLPFTVYGRYVPRDVQARASSSSVFTGSSLYFLHGLSEADQDDYINTLAGDGAKVLRLWGRSTRQWSEYNGISYNSLVTNVPTGCSKGSNVVTNTGPFESDIRTYNYDLLAALDKVLSKMVAKGMKAIISPHDGNALKPGDYRYKNHPLRFDLHCLHLSQIAAMPTVTNTAARIPITSPTTPRLRSMHVMQPSSITHLQAVAKLGASGLRLS